MLNAIVKRLNGHIDEPLALEAELQQLAHDQAAARAALADLQQRRRQALLDDADDRTLDKFERELARAEVRIEKLKLAEPGLRERLANAKQAAHERAVEKHFDIVSEAYGALRLAVLEAEAAQLALIQVRTRAIAEIGERAVATRIPVFAFGGILGHGFAERWCQENDQTLEAARAARERRIELPRSAPSPAPRVELPKARASSAVTLAHGAPLTAEETARLYARPIADDDEPLEPGQSRAKVLRPGYPNPLDGLPCRSGQKIRLAAQVAEYAAKQGALEILETFGENITTAAPGAGAGAEDARNA